MKAPFHFLKSWRSRTMLLGSLLVLPLGAPNATAEEAEKIPARVIEKSRQLQERMSRKFHDQWNEIRGSVEAKARARNSLSSASVDVRERNDGYSVRVHLPGRDLARVEVAFVEGKALRITAPADGKAGRYEQTILLEGVTPGAEPRIERKPHVHLIVVELPKPQTAAEAPPTSEAPPAPPVLLPATDPWDRQILERMERMRHEMDRMFEQAFEDLDDLPDPKDFFDRARFGASVELQDQDGSYIVRAYLPERNAENAKVTLEGGVLKIEAVAEESTENGGKGLVWRKKSQFSQRITLPGPVDAAGLKTERKQGMLVITLPKATDGKTAP
jgi:HSP20 family molecular chaperone IbpA